MSEDIGLLAAALAKAQTDFPVVTRDKTVTVQTKTGGSYSFKYAPLDSILNAVRQPLAANGLVIVQLLDDGALVTSLIHESGAILSGRIDLPNTTDIQGLGSAITYLRRYAIQGMLGIAAEDDDDGNHASGNRVKASGLVNDRPDLGRPELERRADGLQGVVAAGKPPVDLNLRETPDGHAWGFKLTAGRTGYQALAVGPLAEAMAKSDAVFPALGKTVTVWGRIEMVPWDKGGKSMPPFARIAIERVSTPDWVLPADVPVEPETVPLFPDEDEQRAIYEAEMAEAAAG